MNGQNRLMEVIRAGLNALNEPPTLRRLQRMIPSLLCSVCIFIGSTDVLSAKRTEVWLRGVVRAWAPDLTETSFRQVHLVVRKGGHVAEYAILAWLVAWGLSGSSFAQGRIRLLFVSVSAASLVAGADEFHQSFYLSRTGSPVDVAIDSGGALLGGIVACLGTMARGRRHARHMGRIKPRG